VSHRIEKAKANEHNKLGYVALFLKNQRRHVLSQQDRPLTRLPCHHLALNGKPKKLDNKMAG
jgi:hypothetical protein